MPETGGVHPRVVMWAVGALLLPSFAAVALIASINSDVASAADDIGEIKEALKDSQKTMESEHDQINDRLRDHDLRLQAIELSIK